MTYDEVESRLVAFVTATNNEDFLEALDIIVELNDAEIVLVFTEFGIDWRRKKFIEIRWRGKDAEDELLWRLNQS